MKEKKFYKKPWFLIFAGIIILSIIMSQGDDKKKETLKESMIETEKETVRETEKETVRETEKETVRETGKEISLEFKNAHNSALSYLDYTSFSREGLINQLEFEGYSNESAIYAVDNIPVNWNEQAAKKAQEYLDYSSFSRQGLLDQLIYEGFTDEQALYGLEEVGY